MVTDKNQVPQALSGITTLYDGNIAAHGITPESVGWKNESSQRLRFAKLAQVIEPIAAAEGITVNDLGCGYGAMFHYLDQMPGVRLTRYLGYDISEQMLNAAKQFVDDPRAEFIASSHLTQKADYTFASGTFYVKLEASDSVWSSYMKEMLLELNEMSTRGFAFNAMTSYVDWKKENLYYADPFIFFDFCKRNISRYVTLSHDYPLFEWTMIVRKEQ